MVDFLGRLANVLRGIVTDDQTNSKRAWDRGRSSGDPDLDQAWEELDDFLSEGRESPDADSAADGGQRASTGQSLPRGPAVSAKTERAYATLAVPVGAGASEVRAAYKKLMRQHHPDRFAGDAEKSREAARINAAYEHIAALTRCRPG